MNDCLGVEVIGGESLTPAVRETILTLCNRAYEEDLEPLFDTFRDARHVVGYIQGTMVSHALWVTRWLQSGEQPLLRTAYVETVATLPEYQRRGFAMAVMQRLADEIQDYDLGALCTHDPLDRLYHKLGWEVWRGPLFIRMADRLVPTPEELVMILRLPKTPGLDLEAPLSAEWREGELW